MIENLFDVRLKEIRGDLVLLQKAVHVSDALLGIFLHDSMIEEGNKMKVKEKREIDSYF